MTLDYKLVLNVLGAAIFAALFALGARTPRAVGQPAPH